MIGLFALQIDSAKISLEPYNHYNPAYAISVYSTHCANICGNNYGNWRFICYLKK